MGIKYGVDETFFNKWSSDMAYVLGFWYADGSVEFSPAMRGKYIRVTCTDKEIVESIKFAMRSDHTIVTTRKGKRYKDVHLLRIGSAALFDQLVRLGVVERKSTVITIPEVPRQFLMHFVRGYFDGDGCVYLEKNKEKSNYKRMTTVFTSGSKIFLQQLHTKLCEVDSFTESLKINSTYGEHALAYQLRFSTRDSMRLYRLMYSDGLDNGLYLTRKRKIFEEYLERRNITLDAFEDVLITKGPITA